MSSRYMSKYVKFLEQNPKFITDLEAVLGWLSYITPTGFGNSAVVSELILCGTSLFKLFNDLILRQTANFPLHLNATVAKVLTFMAVIEHSEVFAEISAAKMGGESVRWVVITLIQIIKSCFRLLLLLRFGQGLSKRPFVPPLNRKKDLIKTPEHSSQEAPVERETVTTLKRSGRQIRTLQYAPSIAQRNWKLPSPSPPRQNGPARLRIQPSPTELDQINLVGEVLHISRPLLHLASLGLFGKNSWKPWLVAVGCDLTSLQMLGDRSCFNSKEQNELSRRSFLLLVYLLRSPFFDRYTKERMLKVLHCLSNRVPLAGFFIKPLVAYLPHWQQTYFHCWAT